MIEELISGSRQNFNNRLPRFETRTTLEPLYELESFTRELFGATSAGLAQQLWLIVAPHPDDELNGAAWLLARVPRIRVMYVTDGAPDRRSWWARGFSGTRAQYAALRRTEALSALQHVGVPADCVASAGLREGHVANQLPELVALLVQDLEALNPGVVVSCPYEGGHPDHDSTAFALRAALELLARRQAPRPRLIEMTGYHLWGDGLRTGEFLPSTEHVAVRRLNAADRDRKWSMRGCYASQTDVLRAFDVGEERYRVAPKLDFTQPPHTGELYADRLGVRPSGDEFRERVCDAAIELELEPNTLL